MQVSEIMVSDIATCTPGDNLEAVSLIMHEEDVGVVPVVDDEGHPVGVITDRDICLESAKQHKAPFVMHASDIGMQEVITCTTEDDIEDALTKMTTAQVRRLPVVDAQGRLQGMVSLGDLIAKSKSADGQWKIAPEELMTLLDSVTGHH